MIHAPRSSANPLYAVIPIVGIAALMFALAFKDGLIEEGALERTTQVWEKAE